MTPTVIVLAAGSSSRFLAMGGSTHKLQAQLGGMTVLERVLQTVRESGLHWHVVTAADTAHHALQGMGTSIATGVAATPDAQGWLILPGDLPLIQAATLRQVAQLLTQHSVVVPVHDLQAGHPVGFDRRCGPDLMALRGDSGARAVVQTHGPAFQWPTDDAGCTLDVDTPERLQQAANWMNRHPH
jgi:molybdenum cofactor cytidylyltransferase